jgi:hypothetical protein
VLAVWLGIFLAGISLLHLPLHRGEHFFIVIATVAALVGVCYWKGEPPRWRWGD